MPPKKVGKEGKKVLRELYVGEAKISIKEMELAVEKLKKEPNSKEIPKIISKVCHSLEGNSLLAGEYHVAYFATKINSLVKNSELMFLPDFVHSLKQAIIKADKAEDSEKTIATKKLTETMEKLEHIEKEKMKEEEEMRLQNKIMQNISEGFYFVGVDDGIIKYTNSKFEEMFGYKKGEMIGKHVSIVNASSIKDLKQTATEIINCLKKIGEWHGEVLNIKKDGTQFWCYANIFVHNHPVYGKIFISTHTNITKEKEATEQIKEAYKQLQEVDALKNNFIKMISQDLKDPLNVINSYSKLLLSDLSLNDASKKKISIICDAAIKENKLVDNLIDVAMLESGTIKLFKQYIHIHNLIQETVNQQKLSAEKNGIQLIERIAKKLPEVYCDAGRIYQVLENLITNAIKFTKKGKVVVTAKKTGRDIVITVKDTGIGISSEKLPAIFTKFYNVESQSKNKKCSLGLFITKKIVEAHMGKIYAESKVGKGTIITVILPITIPTSKIPAIQKGR